MAICPCSRLSSALFSSEGPRLRHVEVRRGEVKGEPIRLRCHDENGGIDARIPLSGRKSRSNASTEQQANQPTSFLHSHSSRRRQAILGGLLAALSVPSLSNPARSLLTENSVLPSLTAEPTAIQVDEINAYSYEYPVGMGKQPSTFRWVESRKPERYSSAAPLSPDARQRIVSERLDFKNNVVISVSVGPPNSTFLKSNEINSWDAKDVARSVLADKSTARMTTGQRVTEVSILDTKTEEKDGVRYWYYEYVVQKSPTIQERSFDVVRHSVAVTAEREGYLYSLNASTSGKKWSLFSPMFKESVSSFRLETPTTEYVPPYKDPWRFW